jgi:ankyrin repeat protein
VGGPRDWPPLHDICHSCFDGIQLAADLLDRGADPNAYFANEHGPMSVLLGAAGVRHDPAITALLLERGADPNGEPWFGDALYHSVESSDPACLRLLLEHGAKPNGSNALGHALDYDRPEHIRLLLAAGARPTGRELVHAVRRGRDASCVRLLAEHGAELDQPAGEWSTPPPQFRTACVGVVAGLVAAGAKLEPRFADVAQGPLAQWLETSPKNGGIT